MCNVRSTLLSIAAACGSAPGVVNYVDVAYETDVTTVPAATNGVITTNLTMGTAAGNIQGTFNRWYTDEDSTLEFEEGGNGAYFTPVLKVNMKNMTGIKNYTLFEQRGVNLIIVAEDNNGVKWLLRRMRIKAKGVANADKNGYEVEFRGLPTQFPSYEYKGTVTTVEP
jgi:hypothetical protein